jgi:hypothetical protein
LRRTALASVSLTLIVVFSLVGSASALYLEYHYFETDKLVYEVGETIDMVARLIADFGGGGWAYVSFGVVTDQGPVFSEGYFIPPSPDIRYLTSSYLILPEHSSPGENGTTASVIFSIEVFEGSSQVAGDTVLVNLTRGSLEANPLTPLTLEYGSNSTLRFLVSSVHNSTVVLQDNPVLVSISNSSDHKVFQNITTTDQEGVISVTWNDQWGTPGDYNISLSANETESFHSLSEDFTVSVIPPSSTVTVTSSPTTVYCQTPDGSHFESINIEVEHVSQGQYIDGSLVEWQTTLGSGSLASQGTGRYAGTIPFPASPGVHMINLSASHTNYQTAHTQQPIDVIQRDSNLTITIPDNLLSDQDVTFVIVVDDIIVDYRIPSVPVLINLTIGTSEFSTQGVTNSSGHFEWTTHIPYDTWGDGEISVNISDTTFYTKSTQSIALTVSYIPKVDHILVSPVVLGEVAIFQVTLNNPDLQPINSLYLELENSSGILLATGVSDFSGNSILSWLVIPSSQVGVQDFVLSISGDDSRHIANATITIQLPVYHPLHLALSQPSWTAIRGGNITLSYQLDSPWTGQSLEILLNDTKGDIIVPVTNLTNYQIHTSFSVDLGTSLGTHVLRVQINNSLFMPLGVFEMNLTVLGSISASVNPDVGYYREGFDVNLDIIDDTNITPSQISIKAIIDATQTVFALLNDVSPDSVENITLPSWVTPGLHSVTLEISGPYLLATNSTFDLMVWMRTQLTITIINLERDNETGSSGTLILGAHDPMISTISSGLIMSPPPIFCSGTTSTDSATTRETSLESCPRFSSGTSNMSTVSAKFLIASSGNGHKVLKRSDLKDTDSSVIASSTDLDVHPNETTPQVVFDGPLITKSVKKLLASRTLAVKR